MTRLVRSAKLDTRSARAKLAIRTEPYWQKITTGLHLGYRRAGAHGGTWIARAYDPATRKRTYEALGAADDALDAPASAGGDGNKALSFSQAQAKAAAWFPRAFAGAGAGAEQAAIPETVKAVVNGYLKWLDSHRKATTARASRSAADAHILPTLGDIRLSALTATRIRRWHEDLAMAPARLRTRRGASKVRTREAKDDDAKRARRSSANRVLTILKAALNQACAEGAIHSDDAWRKVRPFGGADAARVRWLDKAECTRLLNACPADFGRLVRAALLTGCRYGELCRLQVRDFVDAAGTLHIRTSKSGKARHVPLDDDASAFLRAITAGRAADESLLKRADGKAWAMSHQLRPIAEASATARLDPPANFHALRHTWASHRVMAGAPLMVVAQVLGHADTRMVEKHYGHLGPSYVRDVVRNTALGLGSGEAARTVTPLRVA